MKIIRENKVYVQRNDIKDLANILSALSIPCSNNVFNQIYGDFFICTEKFKYEFLCFEGKEIVDFFNSMDYIIDYDEFNNKTMDELLSYGKNLQAEIIKISDDYDKGNKKLSKKELEKLDGTCLSKYLQMEQIKSMMFYKNGKLKLDLPKEIKNTETNKMLKKFKNIFNK